MTRFYRVDTNLLPVAIVTSPNMVGRIAGSLVAALAIGCFSGYSDAPPRGELRAHRGTFTREMVLSGELEAERGESLVVPPLPSWQTSIKWLVDDGAAVKAGDRVVELDNSALTADLESKRQSATQSQQQLQQSEAEWAADLEQKRLDVDQRKSELDKAKIEAKVPADLLAARVYEKNQLALQKTTVEYQKALDLLASKRTAIEADRRNLLLTIEKSRRAIAIAEGAIAALVLHAPRAGIAVIRDHPWEGRKLQTGDPVWVGFPIAMLPDLGSIRVRAALADVDDGTIAVGMPAEVTLDGYPTMHFDGRVTDISAVAKESRRQSLRRQFDVLVRLDRLDPRKMRPGLSARVVVRRESRPGALIASRAALDLSSRTPRARLAGGGWKNLKLGPCNAQDCVVVSGLDEGEKLAPVLDLAQ